MLVAGALALAGGALLFSQGRAPLDIWKTLTLRQALGTLGVGALVVGLTGLTTRQRAAAMIDRLAATHDRFHTALAFSERTTGTRTPLEELTLAECSRFIEAFPVRRWVPLRVPRAVAFVVVPLVSLGLLGWHASLGIGKPPRDAALDAAVAKRADVLQKLADKLHPPDAKTPRPGDALADAMKRSAQKLKDAADASDAEKLKTALKELSSLEAMLNAMKQAAAEAKVSPAELQALAAALAATEKGKDAADSIDEGQLEQAAGELEKMLEQLKQQGDASQAMQQLAQSMQEQAAKLTEQEKNEVAKQMQQAAQGAQSGQEQLSQQAMQRLAELLRKAGKNGAGGKQQQQASNGSQGKPMTAQQMQELLNALENMKDGLQQPGEDGQPQGSPQEGQGQGQSLALVESFTKKGGMDDKGGGQPSGMPGGEHDGGHPDKLFADTPADAPRSGQAHRLEGVLGEGESLQELVNSPSGPAKAGRRYRDLYEAMAPAAQNTVEQENIPLGSRHFVRRYFENIRPQH